MTPDAPKHRLLRIAIYLMLSVGVGLGILLLGVAYERKIHPGYDTTRIISPKLPDGSIDYLAAVEDHFGQGVTPENNAAVPILQAIGRKGLSPDQPRDGITNRLGMPPLPDDGDYYVTFDEYKHDHPADDAVDTTEPDLPSKWPVTNSPLTAQWIKANEKPLSLFTEASKRSRYFIPFNGGHRPATMMSILLPHLARINNARRAILIRALMRLNDGDVSGYLQDIQTSHRLARLLGTDSTLICRVMAFGAEVATCQTERLGASSGKLSAEQMRQMAKELAAMGDLPSPEEAIDNGERYFVLDIMQVLSKSSPEDRANLLRGALSIDAPDAVLQFYPVRSDESMRILNHMYDGAISAMQMQTYPERVEAFRLWNIELQYMSAQSTVPKVLSPDYPAIVLMPGLANVAVRADTTRMEDRLTQIALALAAFKAEKHSYPATLAELQPAYLESIPSDLFADAPLKYGRTPTGFMLHSVGPNVIDDGGNSKSPADDIVMTVP